MTHESFKQILTWFDDFSKEEIYKYLDGTFENSLLDELFAMWQLGQQRAMFDLMDSMSESLHLAQADDHERVPPDFDRPRVLQNKNLEEMMKKK